MLRCELIADLRSLEALQPEWDALAVSCALPLMTPGWLLGWWHHLAPANALIRSIAVRDEGRLVGFAPFYVAPQRRRRIDYRLPGIEIAARLAPLAASGREWDVALAVAQELAECEPRPDAVALEGMPVASPWPAALHEGWPGVARPLARRYIVQDAPTISLAHDSYEQWLAAKSANFRSQMRRLRRQFAAAGGSARVSTAQSAQADVEAFMRLHAGRWQGRGRSGILAVGERLSAMLRAMIEAQSASGRVRLWLLEVDGEPISAQLFIAAGGEVAYLNGGWDERFARLKPAMLAILHAIEDAFARGERRIDLGAGAQSYKRRLADSNDPVAWTILMLPGRRLALTRLRTTPMLAAHAARDAAKRGLTEAQADRLRAARRRLRARP